MNQHVELFLRLLKVTKYQYNNQWCPDTFGHLFEHFVFDIYSISASLVSYVGDDHSSSSEESSEEESVEEVEEEEEEEDSKSGEQYVPLDLTTGNPVCFFHAKKSSRVADSLIHMIFTFVKVMMTVL